MKSSEDLEPLSDASKLFMANCDFNKLDYNAFFIAMSEWLAIPSKQKVAVITHLIKTGKVQMENNVRKDGENK